MVDLRGRISLDRKALAAFCRREGILKLILFGSALRDDFKPESSDADVLVQFDPHRKITMLGMANIERKQAAIMGIKQKVDLRTIEELHPLFRRNALRDGTVFYEHTMKQRCPYFGHDKRMQDDSRMHAI